jgi:hypothetical protein
LLSEQVVVNGRKYNFDYKEQPNRTIIAISSSEIWDERDADAIAKLSLLLSKRFQMSSNPKLHRMLFVQKIDPSGNVANVPIEELKATSEICLQQM